MAVKGKNAMVKKEVGSLPTAVNMEVDAGAGFESITPEDMQTPFLVCLQKGSPQVDDDNPKAATLPGAKTGMLLNSVTNELYDGEEGVLVIPCHYKRSFVQWGNRDEGGGFMGEHPPESPLLMQTSRDEQGRDVLPDGSHLADTRSHLVLLVKDDGTLEPMMLSMSSTQIKKSKRWMTLMRTLKVAGSAGKFNPPMYSHIYRIRTVAESNAKGNWRGLNITLECLVTNQHAYKQAKELYMMAVAGIVKTAPFGEQETSGESVPY